MYKQNDIFPETLLVEVKDSHIFTTSLKIAEHFNKPHDDVLKVIRKAISRCKTPEQLGNFSELLTEYTVQNGAKRKRPIYHLTRDGFTFIAFSFTGEKAFQWQWDFIDAFNQMEAALKQKTERRASALFYLRPHWRVIEQCIDEGLSRAETCLHTGHKSPDTISANKRRMRDLGLLN
jgi:Rha family phage regulatory protein